MSELIDHERDREEKKRKKKKKKKEKKRKKIVVNQLQDLYVFVCLFVCFNKRLSSLSATYVWRLRTSPMLSESGTYYSMVFCR